MSAAASHRVPLERDAFYAPDVFAAEQQAIGERHWVLLGPAQWVCRNGDWITSRIGEREIFVQRFGERLAGFENVCAHRFAELRDGRRGNGPVVCPYHGWAYDASGVAVGIPHCRELFGVQPRELTDRRLMQVEVQVLGEFVFGRMPSPTAPPFEEEFGREGGLFSAFAKRRLELFSDHEMTIAANWKLAFENTLDDYHIAVVHPTTFGADGRMPPGQFRYGHHQNASVMLRNRSGLSGIDFEQITAAIAQGNPPPVEFAIYNFFPDMLVAVFMGRILVVSRYEAPDVARTRMRSYLFDLIPADGKPLSAARRNVMAAYFSKLFEEDRGIVERLGRGFRQSWMPPLHGAQEERILDFERAWTALVHGREDARAVA